MITYLDRNFKKEQDDIILINWYTFYFYLPRQLCGITGVSFGHNLCPNDSQTANRNHGWTYALIRQIYIISYWY